ncbi:MAG TPA: hypothetical protein VKU39_18270 [Streptosporangiaceae bacterium]|nr:hypothetical protein [Streptosporangiaceae bacterium]
MLDARRGRNQAADQRADRTGRRLAWAWGLALFALAVIALWFIYLQVSRTQRVESDGASNALQAWDMLHGNLLLRGWTVTDVSFYTTELPEYLLVEAVKGLNADVLHVAASLSYALLVPLAAILAKGRATGREGLIRMLIAAGLMIAPEPGAGVFILLFQPDHIGTQVPMLATWLVLDRVPRRWFSPVLIGLMLTWVGIGDKIVLLIGVAPLILVCAVRALRMWRSSPRGKIWFEVSLALAAAVSVGLADLFVRVIGALGGYTVLPVGTQLASPHALPQHLRLATDGVLGLFGANFQGPPHGWNLVFASVHLAGVAVAIIGLAWGIRTFFRNDDLIAQILVASIVINLAAYLLSGKPTAYWSVREMAGVLPAGAVLAGRVLGPGLATLRGGWRKTVAGALAAVLACYLAALGWAASLPNMPGVGQDLAGYLRTQHLSYGLAEYGLANSTTLAAGNDPAVRPVVVVPGKLAPGPHEYDLTWYDPAKRYANFVVLLTEPAQLDPMTRTEAEANFGLPARILHYGMYEILVWNKNLLPQLAPQAPD